MAPEPEPVIFSVDWINPVLTYGLTGWSSDPKLQETKVSPVSHHLQMNSNEHCKRTLECVSTTDRPHRPVTVWRQIVGSSAPSQRAWEKVLYSCSELCLTTTLSQRSTKSCFSKLSQITLVCYRQTLVTFSTHLRTIKANRMVSFHHHGFLSVGCWTKMTLFKIKF